MFFTLQYSCKGMGRNSVLYNSAFNHLANKIKFGNVADIPISCILMSSLLKYYTYSKIIPIILLKIV